MLSEQTSITRNRLLGTISKLGKQYLVHVEFMIAGSFPTNNWYNLFHATISGNFDVYGSRIPAIIINHNDGNIFTRIACAVSGTVYKYDSPAAPIQLNKWVAIDVSQTKVADDYQYKVEINGEVVQMVKNTKPQEFENVKIYISNPWIRALPGYVRNVYMKGKV